MLGQKVEPVEVKTIAERPPMYHPSLPYPMSLSNVDWEILTPELMGEYLQNLEKGDAPRRAFYSLSSKSSDTSTYFRISEAIKTTCHHSIE